MKKQLKGLGKNVLQPFIHTIHDTIDQLSQEHIVVSLPTTQGFIDRICPNGQCRATFKVNMNTWTGGNMLSCVKCGNQYSRDMFTTAQQHEYAISVALNTINEKYNFGWISSSETYIPPDTDTKITCETCQCCYIVRGKFGYCPQCGRHNCLQWAILKVALLKNKAYSSEQDFQTGYKEIVDILKTCGDQILDIYNQRHSTTHSISLQNFEVAEDALRNKIGINLKEVFSPEQLSTIIMGINIRHICAYNASVIDGGFIKRTNSHHNQIGRVYRFSSDELHTFIELVERLLQFYFDKITNITTTP
jgi:hypothetical protein